MISLYYKDCSVPILSGSAKHMSTIVPPKGKDAWEVRNDETGEVIASHNPHQATQKKH